MSDPSGREDNDAASTTIGIALSGGGNRAAAWGFGTLLAVTDAGANRRTVSVASVSGGSIANGVVANDVDYPSATGADLERAIAPCLRMISTDGLFFMGRPTAPYVHGFFAIVALIVAVAVAAIFGLVTLGWRLHDAWGLAVGGVAVLITAFVLWRIARRSRTKPNRWPTTLYVTIVAVIALSGPGAWLVAHGSRRERVGALLLALVLIAILAAAALWWFGRRSFVVDRALATGVLTTGGRPTKLRELAGRATHHVFCATELQSGNHCYLSPSMVYTYQVGWFTPADVLLSTAVQASASLPGAFLARRLTVDEIGKPRRPWLDDGAPPEPTGFEHLLLNDGGVYDNMADQWEQGFAKRAERWPELATYQQRGADLLVVANASKGLVWSPDTTRSSLMREVGSLSRSVDVVYDVSTAHRRANLIDKFRTSATVTGPGQARLGLLDGLIVHIGRSPSDLAKAWSRGTDTRAERALEAQQLLRDVGVDERPFMVSAGVPTTLGVLGTTATTDLLHHAYLLTTFGLYIIHGIGDLEGGADRFGRARFAALAEGE